MAKKRSKGVRHCVRTKTTRGGRRCAAYAPGRYSLGDMGDLGDMGRIARVITIPGRGVRCQTEQGKFTPCLAGDLGDLGDLGHVHGRVQRTARRTSRRVSRRQLGKYIPCRTAKGQFTKCR